MAKADLKIDWATHEAAKYACENWHYSGCLPSSMQKRVAVGAWESNVFMGVVVFGHGANPSIGKPYGLTINECVELTRISLKKGHKSPVSRIVRVALMFLVKSQPKLRLVVSYADQGHGHHGGVYQAGNWVYVGSSKGVPSLRFKGKVWHAKALRTSYPSLKHSDPRVEKVPTGDKHKFLMPLDKEMAEQIKPLAKPYPKREKQAMASFPEAQRQGGTDLHAPNSEGSGDLFPTIKADAA
jgi:hypothetical protein